VIGYAGDRDPALSIFQDGSIAAGFTRDLRVSREGGCSWSAPFSNAAKENLIDATGDPSDPTNALFLSRSLDATHLVHVFVANQTASALVPLDGALGDDVSPLTLEVAPSLPSRIYVTGLNLDLTTTLLRSDDRGQNWRRLAIHPDETLAAYIAAVDPTNPDRLYLRLDGDVTDILLVSDDGGQTFAEAFSIDADMLGFAISPDGGTIALGGPAAGVFVADSASLAFVQSPATLANLSCLKWTDAGLFACARESTDGFTLASSTDAGQSFTPLFHLGDLKPLSCDAKSAVGSRCPFFWPTVAQSLGIDTRTPGGPSVEPTSSSSPSGGCGCALPPARRWHSGAIATLALLGAAMLRRRQRQGTSM
jgi:hypothetical protein